MVESWGYRPATTHGYGSRDATGWDHFPCLANATLNGLETQLKRHLAKKLGIKKAEKTKVQCVRYADDFVILAASKELLEEEVKPWVEQFLSVRGVELSREKRASRTFTRDSISWGGISGSTCRSHHVGRPSC